MNFFVEPHDQGIRDLVRHIVSDLELVAVTLNHVISQLKLHVALSQRPGGLFRHRKEDRTESNSVKMSLHAFTPCIPLNKRTNTTYVTSVTRCVPQMTNSRNPRRRRPNKRPQDLFDFFDEEEVNPSRSRNNRMRRPRRKRNTDSEEGEDVDDAVDDGFFSRYRKDAESGRIFDVSDLDAEAKEEFKSSSANHQKAARAFDAVDKLFGDINAKKDKKTFVPSTSDDQIDKSSWLDDIKARAATSGESESANAVDVQAVHESTLRKGIADEDDFSEAQVAPDPDDKEPFSNSEEQEQFLRTAQNKNSEKRISQASQASTFQRFVSFARQGPASMQDRDSKERPLWKERNVREDSRRRSRASSFPKVFNNTRSFDRYSGDTYEPEDDEMETEIEVGHASSRNQSGRRQQFHSVRRVNGRPRRILTPPRGWEAMEADDVQNVRSTNRTLGGRFRPSHLRNAVADCTSCRGSGMETCALCVGSGWVAPMKEFARLDGEKRKALYEEFWSTPGLVIDSQGNAQCIRCNGIGKQFCGKCKGSGSALETGFNFNDRHKVFDMFPDVTDEAMIDNDYDEDDFEDEDEVEDDFESFQLYRGSVDSFDLSTGKGRTNDSEDKLEDDEVVLGVADDEDEVLSVEDEDADVLNVEGDEEDMDEVEDESKELLEALTSMDLRDEKSSDSVGDLYSPLEKRDELLEDEEDEEDEEDLDFEVEDDEFEEESEDSRELYDLELEDFPDGVDGENANGGGDGEYAFDEDQVGDGDEVEEVAGNAFGKGDFDAVDVRRGADLTQGGLDVGEGDVCLGVDAVLDDLLLVFGQHGDGGDVLGRVDESGEGLCVEGERTTERCGRKITWDVIGESGGRRSGSRYDAYDTYAASRTKRTKGNDEWNAKVASKLAIRKVFTVAWSKATVSALKSERRVRNGQGDRGRDGTASARGIRQESARRVVRLARATNKRHVLRAKLGAQLTVQLPVRGRGAETKLRGTSVHQGALVDHKQRARRVVRQARGASKGDEKQERGRRRRRGRRGI
ncbi:hypothetical protein FGB62_58g051 [Gracilaria domingensis]|nr:hypothetical protein FGB62_58g051 [Gracilaria domingensis]